ncbi:patatin [Ectothiorhodospira haloalkaliphila]|uniref:Patatin n=1 Tax=Ectothiorhodospira haloalkaliphila TaxID=421628 RepID=W8KS06_9GAMM|nr:MULTISPECIES: patatin-like phospholipase family protein [Ectothiorhodospira]AHK79792.1 patatin [Ectothiorhodospira haloalkaliphila]MCG5494095.1 patatin-like phospholipase family protein [Ectothiorhodospira variabilis]MCG5497972.1 patatin-like phospholipase family protein [Ectothiorhodospira variabilis]MCG5503375.1 patatin-like phospholipase family protein [Ectothiorhodospira variabilis]MCG5506537.1 patatin-like phospholipase family protein [Ectothiorhodospira variabilis]
MSNSAPSKTIDLALQGGGAHGALTWGVLDRLLEDPRIHISSVSGTSAGAMNAVVMADGLDRAGREGARDALTAFWKAVSDGARLSPIQRTIWDRLSGRFSMDHSPGYLFFEQLTRQFSPYELNPLNINPLRDLVAAQIDFERVNHCSELKVFVTATNVRTGRGRIFTQPELTVDTVMASACLPFMFQAVEINGEAYWDGGYIGNPALYPLVEDTTTRDLVIVQINPMVREELPRTGRDIINRLNEITFNASLIKELRAIELLHQLIEAEKLESERYRDIFVHLIHAHEELKDLDASSKLNAEWEYLTYLRDRGRNWADAFLNEHFDDLGQRSSFDLRGLFTDTFAPPDLDQGGNKDTSGEPRS